MKSSLTLRIAGLNFKLNFLPIESTHLAETFIDSIKRDYSGFIVKESNIAADFIVNIVEPDLEMIYMSKQKTYYLNFFRSKGKNTFETFYRIGPTQFSSFLMQILLRTLGKKDAFILHSSSVKIGNNANLFMAFSGGGKSTIMKFLNDRYTSLADDSVIIKKEKGKYYMYQTPAIEKEWWIKKGGKRYDLGTLYLINKSESIYEDGPIDKDQAMFRLMNQLMIVEKGSKEQAKRLMEFVKNYHDVRLLYFPKNRDKVLKYFEAKNK